MNKPSIPQCVDCRLFLAAYLLAFVVTVVCWLCVTDVTLCDVLGLGILLALELSGVIFIVCFHHP